MLVYIFNVSSGLPEAAQHVVVAEDEVHAREQLVEFARGDTRFIKAVQNCFATLVDTGEAGVY